MNFSVFKDFKTILGFITSILFSVAGILMAAKENQYWVTMIVMALIFSYLSVRRAEKNDSK
jgi:hypothetical protein